MPIIIGVIFFGCEAYCFFLQGRQFARGAVRFHDYQGSEPSGWGFRANFSCRPHIARTVVT
jgi:hypothetical protein